MLRAQFRSKIAVTACIIKSELTLAGDEVAEPRSRVGFMSVLKTRGCAIVTLICRCSRPMSISRGRLVMVCDSKAKFFVGGNWKANGTQDSIAALINVSDADLCMALGKWAVSISRFSTLIHPICPCHPPFCMQDLNHGADRINTREVDVVVAPTYVHLGIVKAGLDSVYHIAAQNVWLKGTGAFTGEIPAEVLVDLGIDWTITGHSERRALCGETSQMVGAKTARALELGMSVIPCIGETLEQRKSGQLFSVLEEQVQALVDQVKDWSRVVIAYEPVWAIGTGVVASPAQAQEVHAYLRE